MDSSVVVERVGERETLYRRVPKDWHSEAAGTKLEGFTPTKADADGLSLSRGILTPEEVAATGRVGKSFWVARLNADAVRAIGLTLVPDRVDHCYIPEMSRSDYDNPKRKPAIQGWARRLIGAVEQFTGPFPGQAPPVEK